MNGWIFFWGALLLVTLVSYTVMVVYVSIGGLRDIRQMFRSLSGDGENNPAQDDDERNP